MQFVALYESALQTPQIQELLIIFNQYGSRKTFGKVFDVWYAKADDDEYSSFWMIHLHGAFRFFGFTIPIDD